MADTWWSKRFTGVLESYGLGARMQRGRRYARSGLVLSVDVTPGLLVAHIQASRRTPSVASHRSAAVPEHCWTQLDEATRSRSGSVARLLAAAVQPVHEAASDQ